jgi:hypothetical protein
MTTKAITRGRPQSNNTHCKICGQQLIIGVNARETSKGSGRPRNKCTKCENAGRYKRRNPKPTKLVFDDNDRTITLKIAAKWQPRRTTTISYERLNPVGMSAQIETPYTKVEKWAEVDGTDHYRRKTYFYYEDMVCDECGGIVRFDENYERVCEDCGLVHGTIEVTDADVRGWQRSIPLSENHRKNGPRFKINRDGEHDNDKGCADMMYRQLYSRRLKNRYSSKFD